MRQLTVCASSLQSQAALEVKVALDGACRNLVGS